MTPTTTTYSVAWATVATPFGAITTFSNLAGAKALASRIRRTLAFDRRCGHKGGYVTITRGLRPAN